MALIPIFRSQCLVLNSNSTACCGVVAGLVLVGESIGRAGAGARAGERARATAREEKVGPSEHSVKCGIHGKNVLGRSVELSFARVG